MQKTYEDLARLGNETAGFEAKRAHRENTMNETMSRKHELLKARQAQLVERMKSLGVERVEVDYDGSGDSGDIQGVSALKNADKGETIALAGQSIVVERLESVYDHEAKEYKRVPNQVTIGLEGALGDFATDFLSYLGIDWYNNEGGYGTVVLNVEDGEVKAEHYYRIESSEYSEHTL